MYIRKSVFKRSIALATISGIIIGVLVTVALQPAQSKTFLWTQSSWAGGVSTATLDGDPSPPANWSNYAGKDEQILADATGLEKPSVRNGMMIFWDGNGSVPSGWTDVTTTHTDWEGRLVRIASTGAGATGGASGNQHNHTVSLEGDILQLVGNSVSYPKLYAMNPYNHDLGHSVNSTTATLLPPYRKLRLIERTGGTTAMLPASAIGFFENDSFPVGWTSYTSEADKFVMISNAAGGEGGQNEHNHSVSGSLSSAINTLTLTRGGSKGTAGSHNHSVTATLSTESHVPLYSGYPMAKLGSTQSVPVGMLALFNTLPSAPWQHITSESGRYLRNTQSSATWPDRGGSVTHDHDSYEASVGGSGAPAIDGNIQASDSQHIPTANPAEGANSPLYVDLYLAAFKPIYHELLSSKFDSTDPSNVLAAIIWEESDSATNGSKARFQMRTASSQSGLDGAGWIGPDGTSGTYFEYPNVTGCSKSGTTATCDFLQMSGSTALRDASGDQWFQYKIELIEGVKVEQVTTKYVRNTAPDVESTGASQTGDGIVNISFQIKDEETDNKLKPYLFYDVGVTLSNGMSEGATVATVNDPLGFMDNIPSSGQLLIGDEIIAYTGTTASSFTGLTRQDANTLAATHAVGDGVWVKSSQVSFSGATQPCADLNSGLSGCYSASSSLSAKTATWLARNEISGIYRSDFKVRVVLNDGALVRNTSLAAGSISPSFTFDVAQPALNFEGLPPITLMDQDHTAANCAGANSSLATCQKTNANLTNVLLSAQDDTSLQMNLSTDGSFPGGNWAGYTPNPTVTLPGTCSVTTGCAKTVYVKFRDAKGNETPTQTDTIVLDTIAPPAPLNPIIQDISNPAESDFKLYVSWGVITDPGDFHHYNVWRSTPDNQAFAKLKEIPDATNPNDTPGDETQNFHVDNNLTQLQRYYYYSNAQDDIGNISGNTQTVDLDPDQGPAAGGEGAPSGDTTPPVISNIVAGTPDTSSVTITWNTDELADSQVLYSTTFDFDSSQGVPTNVTSGHSVTLVGLIPGMTYNFKVQSTDLAGNAAVGPSDTFQTTALSTQGPTISNVNVSNLSQNGARITWSTNEPATSIVQYGESTSYGSAAGNFAMSQSHSVDLTNLDPSSTYHYRVRSANSSGVETIDSNRTFTTQTDTSDTTAPVISNIQVSNIQPRFATVSWSTDDQSTSFVEWGTDTTYGSIFGNETMTANHSIILPAILPPATLIYYRVRSVNAQGLESISQGGTFTTANDPNDTTPPLLTSGPTVVNVTPNTATIQWSSNEQADSFIGYSTDNSFGTEQGTPTLTTNHTVLLVGLTAGTQYNYKLKFTDAAGNKTELTDPSYNFDTPGLSSDAIAITPDSVVVSGITHNSATIDWQTDEFGDSFVEYGFDESFGAGAGQFDSTDTHSVVLNGLLSETEYSFRVHSKATNKSEAFSETLTFTTTKAPDNTPPTISGIEIAQVGTTGVSISWETDEPSIGRINYGSTSALGSQTTLESVHVASPHTQTVSGLAAGSTYHYQIYAQDAAGNAATSTVSGTFVTKPEEASNNIGPGTISLDSIDFDPPGISEVVVKELAANSAIVTWTSNEAGDSVVEYGTTTGAYVFTEASLEQRIAHAVPLTRLNASTTYYFRVSSADLAGNRGKSNEFFFSTLPGADPSEGTDMTDEDLEAKLQELLGVAPEAEGAPEITDIRVSSVTPTSALINWNTNKNADSQVRYGFSTEYDKQTERTTEPTREHWVQLSDLTPNALYHFQVQSADADGNTALSGDTTFRTLLEGAENIPPLLTEGPTVTDITSTSATVRWITDRAGTSIVRYKASRSFLLNLVTRAVQIGDFETFSIQHAIELPNLRPDTAYRYQVLSQAPDGTVMRSEEGLFRTKATSEIFDVRIQAITYNSAQISWKTGTRSTTELEFGRTGEYGDSVRQLEFGLEHSVNLTGLTPDTLYHFRLRGTDEKGQSVLTNDFTFVTFGIPVIEERVIEQLNESEVVVQWRTDKETDTFVLVTDETGKQQNFGSPELATDHKVSITGLEGDKEYNYQIIAKDRFGQEASSQVYGFRTGRDNEPPIISQVRTETSLKPDGKGIQAVVSWVTDEQANSRITYRKGLTSLDDDVAGVDAPSVIHDDSLSINHVVVIPDFEPGAVYRFRVSSADKNDNIGVSKDFTVLAPKQTGSIVDIIIENLEQTFGFLRQLQQ